jgi:hypothetical protein
MAFATVFLALPWAGAAPPHRVLVTVEADNDPGRAPGTATVGEAEVPMDRIRLRTDMQTSNFTGITLSLIGTAVPADVASVRLFADNGDGNYDPNLDQRLGEGTFNASKEARFSGFSVLLTPQRRSFWVVLNVSAGAAVGHRLQTNVSSNASVGVRAGDVVDQNNFPLESGQTEIVAAPPPMMAVGFADLAANRPTRSVRQGETAVQMLRLDLSVPSNSSTVTGLRVDRQGSSQDADVPTAHLYYDANRNGALDLSDPSLGTGSFVGATTTFSGLNLSVLPADDESIFITYDIASAATVLRTLNARLASEAYITTAGLAPDPGDFPDNSATLTIIAAGTGSILSTAPTDLANNRDVRQGRKGVAMLDLNFTVDAGQANITGMRVDHRQGGGTDSDISAIHLYLDSNRNAIFDPADAKLNSSAFVGGAAVMGFRVEVKAASHERVFIVIDIAATAVVGNSHSVEVRANYLQVEQPALVNPANFPARSTEVTIISSTAPPRITVGSTDLAAAVPNRQVGAGAKDVGMLTLTLSSDVGSSNFTGLKVTKRGSAPDGVLNASLWKDDGDLKLDPAKDSRLGSGGFVGGVSTITGLGVAFSAGGPLGLHLTVDVASSAAAGATFSFSADREADVAVSVGIVQPDGFPHRSSELTVSTPPPPPTGTINVEVKDAESRAAVPGASVNVSGTGYAKTLNTDAAGKVDFTDVPAGAYTVRVAHVDYEPPTDQSAVLTAANRTANVTFGLARKGGAGGPGGASTLLIFLVALVVLAALLGLLLMRRRTCPECGANWKMGQAQCWKCGHKPEAKRDEKKEERLAEEKKDGKAASLAKDERAQVEREEPGAAAQKAPDRKDDMVPPAPLD